MCIIPASKLSSEDLAVLGCSPTSCEADEDSPEFELSYGQPGDAFGFGPVPLSQIIRAVDPRDLDQAA